MSNGTKLLVYKYRAVDVNGYKVTGELTAKSSQEVIDLLHERDCRPINIEEKVKTAKELGQIEISPIKVKTKELTVFCRQLSTMLRAGLALDKAMRLLIGQTSHKTLNRVLEEVSARIGQGISLSSAMKEHGTVFPRILVNMIEAGELTGSLDIALVRMADHFAKQNKMNNKIKGAMIYPIILLCMTFAVFTGLMLFIVPIFIELFESSGIKMPAITRFLISVSKGMTSYWYLYLAGVAGIVYGIKAFLAWDKGRQWFDMRKLTLPLVRGPMRQLVTARFTRTLSTLLSSGIQLVNALSSAAETVNNVIIEKAVIETAEDVKKGVSLTAQLEKIPYFPRMMTSMVGIGEESGELDGMLEKTADYYDEEADAAIKKLTSFIEPFALLMVGIVVGVVVIAMYLPMFQSYSALG